MGDGGGNQPGFGKAAAEYPQAAGHFPGKAKPDERGEPRFAQAVRGVGAGFSLVADQTCDGAWTRGRGAGVVFAGSI